MGTPRFEEPVDADEVDELEEEDAGGSSEEPVSDVYELRNCSCCGRFLPLDKPARLVGPRRPHAEPVCDPCFELYY